MSDAKGRADRMAELVDLHQAGVLSDGSLVAATAGLLLETDVVAPAHGDRAPSHARKRSAKSFRRGLVAVGVVFALALGALAWSLTDGKTADTWVAGMYQCSGLCDGAPASFSLSDGYVATVAGHSVNCHATPSKAVFDCGDVPRWAWSTFTLTFSPQGATIADEGSPEYGPYKTP